MQFHLQELLIAQDGVERCPQLVAHVGQETSLRFIRVSCGVERGGHFPVDTDAFQAEGDASSQLLCPRHHGRHEIRTRRDREQRDGAQDLISRRERNDLDRTWDE